jgi:hypothetical protein
MSWTSWCNKVPFCNLFWELCDDVQLCNRCVCEFLILARTWFAFGLPSKTGCDTSLLLPLISSAPCAQPPPAELPAHPACAQLWISPGAHIFLLRNPARAPCSLCVLASQSSLDRGLVPAPYCACLDRRRRVPSPSLAPIAALCVLAAFVNLLWYCSRFSLRHVRSTPSSSCFWQVSACARARHPLLDLVDELRLAGRSSYDQSWSSLATRACFIVWLSSCPARILASLRALVFSLRVNVQVLSCSHPLGPFHLHATPAASWS